MRRDRPARHAIAENELRAWARVHVLGVDTNGFSYHALLMIYVRRERKERLARSVDRLTARVVWPECLGPLPWMTLAIAGPRGELP